MELLLHTKQNLEIIEQLKRKFPNDFELGREARKIFSDNKFVINTPNDGELGKIIRNIKKDKK